MHVHLQRYVSAPQFSYQLHLDPNFSVSWHRRTSAQKDISRISDQRSVPGLLLWEWNLLFWLCRGGGIGPEEVFERGLWASGFWRRRWRGRMAGCCYFGGLGIEMTVTDAMLMFCFRCFPSLEVGMKSATRFWSRDRSKLSEKPSLLI